MLSRVNSYHVKTMEALRDALDKTRHGDGHMISKFPIKYPKFVVERFVSRPLANTREHAHDSAPQIQVNVPGP